MSGYEEPEDVKNLETVGFNQTEFPGPLAYQKVNSPGDSGSDNYGPDPLV